MKVVRSESGAVVAFGPNEDFYDPGLKAGEVLTIEDDFVPVVIAAPIVVSPRQIRQALTAAGLRINVESAIAASGNQDLKDWWEFATPFEENHPMVVQMALDLQVDGEALHILFVLAASL